jgi:tyrosinase
MTGPFANMTVHIGPLALAQYGTTVPASVPNPLDDHSRCLKRDLNAGVASRFTTFRNTTTLILQNQNVEWFQAIMQADPRYVHGELGVHGGGHFTIGGDPGADPFISPGDPAFYLHHSQVDRVWWIWQMLDFTNRQVSLFYYLIQLLRFYKQNRLHPSRTFLEPERLWTSLQVPTSLLTI